MSEVVSIELCAKCQGAGGTIRYPYREKNTCKDCDKEDVCIQLDDDGCKNKVVSRNLIHTVCTECEGSGRIEVKIIRTPYKSRSDINE